MLLWRYLTKAAWRRLAADPRLPLSRIAGFDDAFECTVPIGAAASRDMLEDDAHAQQLFEAAALQRRSWASCWFADEHESMAMWDLHVGRREVGVAIAVLYTDLHAIAPPGARVEPVSYMRHDDASIEPPWV